MADTKPKPRPPAGLDTGGRKLWRELADVYEFDGAEPRLLAELCKQVDLVDALAAAVAEHGVMVRTADGDGVKLNTAVTELRQGRLAVARLVAALRLPDEGGRTEQRRQGVRGVYAAGGSS
ncbi:terminase [Mycolicibacterium gilvum]|uniref:terminase n=1 Tax=Mycolicibacterium gilvum TaxID=1804 RepID=UPI004045EAB9